jgi:lipopolysaccharide export LptBFGC system permease protein LptF
MNSEKNRLINQYNKLNDSIKITIRENNKGYANIQSIDNEYYANNKKKFMINEKITNLVEHRNNIWNFLNDKYTDNTKLRKNLYKRAENLIRQKDENIKEIEFLEDKLRDMKTNATTTKRNFQSEKYQKQRYEYYSKLHQMVISSFVCCLVILSIAYIGLISTKSAFIITAIIILSIICYVIYYVYILNINRHHMEWDKINHNSPKVNMMENSTSYQSDENMISDEQQRILNDKLEEMTKI